MIESLDNKRVKEWTKLNQKKYRLHSYLAHDAETIEVARQHKAIEVLIYVDEPPFSFENSVEVSSSVLYKICQKEKGYCAVLRKASEKEPIGPRILLLDELQDPLNVGILLHNAKEFGFNSIILSENTADIYHEKALQESKGAQYFLCLRREDLKKSILALKKQGYSCYATGLWKNTKDLKDIPSEEKMAFVMGNEGSGVRKEVMELCDDSVKIEMESIDSLNVAIAGSIVMHSYPGKKKLFSI